MAIFNLPIARVADDNFRVGSGYKLYFYESGTSTAKDTYTDNTYVTANANPVVADGNGRFSVIWTSGDYKVVLKTDADVTVWTVDDYNNDANTTKFAESVLSAAGSAADVITANLSTTPGTLEDQQQVVVELQHGANTIANPTFNLNSLGAKTIVRDNDMPLRDGDTGGSGYKLYLSYSSTKDAWVLLNPAKPSNGLGDRWYEGLSVTNGTDTDHDIDIEAGSIVDATGAMTMFSSSSYTKQIDANWAEGSAAGGFPSGLTLTADTWYRVFMISKTDGTTDFGFDTDSSATNLLADATGYTLYRRVFWVRTDASSNILRFGNNNNIEIIWDATQSISSSVDSTGSSIDGITPPNQIGMYRYTLGEDTTTLKYGVLTQTGSSNTAPSSSFFHVVVRGDGTNSLRSTAVIRIRANNNGNIRHREDVGTDSVNLDALGWVHDVINA